MRIILLTFLSIFVIINPIRAGYETDSLLKILPKQKDSERIATLYELVSLIQSENPEQTRKYAKEMLTIAKNTGLNDDFLRTYIGLAKAYSVGNDTLTFLRHLKSAETYCNTSNKSELKAETYRVYGYYYEIINQPYKAIFYYQKALAFARLSTDKRTLYKALEFIAESYNSLSDYTVALNYALESAQIAEKMKNNRLKIRAYINIGNIYNNRKELDKAADYFLDAIALSDKLKEKSSEYAGLHMNIGHIFQQKNDFNKALQYYTQAYEMFTELNSIPHAGQALAYVGMALNAMGRSNEALEKVNRAKEMLEKINDEYALIAVHFNLSEIYQSQQNYPAAIFSLKKALGLAQKMKMNDYISMIYNKLSHIYELTRQPVEALKYYRLHVELKDSLINKEKILEFAKIESKYEFEKQAEAQKQAETQMLKAETEEKERRNNLQYLFIFAGIIGLFTGLILIGKLNIPTRITEVLIFVGLLITFEYLLIVFDPWLDEFSGGIPFYKLAFNLLVALCYAPLHSFLESKMRKRLVKNK